MISERLWLVRQMPTTVDVLHSTGKLVMESMPLRPLMNADLTESPLVNLRMPHYRLLLSRRIPGALERCGVAERRPTSSPH